MRNVSIGLQQGERRPGVQSIARAAAVLRALERAPEGLGLGQIAAAAELPKSTAHRIIGALAEEDLVAQAADGRIRLGGAIARLGSAGREAMAERLRPIMLALRRELDETVDLAVLDGAAVRFVGQVAAPRRLRATSSIGEVFPLHCTANGKALLAALPEAQALALLPKRLPRFTPHTVTSREELLDELAGIRHHGVAHDRGEHTEGICAIGAAVGDSVDPAAAAISVPVPSQRFRGAEVRIEAAVIEAAATASGLLTSD
jgi:DNA-binding IclR family transcriptional regulator